MFLRGMLSAILMQYFQCFGFGSVSSLVFKYFLKQTNISKLIIVEIFYSLFTNVVKIY
jgi:predicted membrane-bound spermidine synthase